MSASIRVYIDKAGPAVHIGHKYFRRTGKKDERTLFEQQERVSRIRPDAGGQLIEKYGGYKRRTKKRIYLRDPFASVS
jgi:hypothetical protein